MKFKTRDIGFLGGIFIALALMLATVLGYGSPAIAASGPADFTLVFPAGLACAGFDLQVEVWQGKQHTKEFKDKNGIVRTIIAGPGSPLRYTNLGSGATFSTKSNGAATHITLYPDGTSTWSITGHFVVFLFPSDFPPGPSTTLFAGGHIVFFVDEDGNYHVEEESGHMIDICAVLSQ